jgi:hypothetical protein
VSVARKRWIAQALEDLLVEALQKAGGKIIVSF